MTSEVRPYRYGLDAKAVGWVEDVLSTGENSTNTELNPCSQKQGPCRADGMQIVAKEFLPSV